MFAQEPLQQSLCRPGIAANLDDFVEHISVLFDGAPEIALFAIDCDDNLVEMPYVSSAWFLSLQTPGIVRSKFLSPDTNGFIGHDDAAFEQQFLNQPQAERKPKIEPYRVGDNLRRKTVALVADRRLGHLACIARISLPQS